MEKQELLLAHSPDSDDAFMFYALATRKIRSRLINFKHVLHDIETLNRFALEGKFDVTAISFHAYPYLADRYRLLSTGSSMGDGYGPMVVSPHPFPAEELKGKKIAIPGLLTTAWLVLKLFEPKVEPVVVPFDRIVEAVRDGRTDAGLLIHEGQLTYDREGLHKIVDLGRWWHQQQGLPVPLGGLVVSRQLSAETQKEAVKLVRRSIEYAMDHREEALAYAMQFARDLEQPLAEKFIGMYVNEFTLDCGERGRQAIERLLNFGHQAGVIPKTAQLDIL
jgi:1,4-dihydroxy-6-naphthoate synthase